MGVTVRDTWVKVSADGCDAWVHASDVTAVWGRKADGTGRNLSGSEWLEGVAGTVTVRGLSHDIRLGAEAFAALKKGLGLP